MLTGIKYQAAIRHGDIIHYSWILDCCNQKRLLLLQPKLASVSNLLALLEFGCCSEYKSSDFFYFFILFILFFSSILKVLPFSCWCFKAQVPWRNWCILWLLLLGHWYYGPQTGVLAYHVIGWFHLLAHWNKDNLLTTWKLEDYCLNVISF